MAYIKKRNLFKRLQFELEQNFGTYWEGKIYRPLSGMRENKYLIIYKEEPGKLGYEKEQLFFYDEKDFINKANEILLKYGKIAYYMLEEFILLMIMELRQNKCYKIMFYRVAKGDYGTIYRN
jgi:hypothetical protein